MDNLENAGNIESARAALAGAELRDGSITAVFERTGKEKVSYSHRRFGTTQMMKLGKDITLFLFPRCNDMNLTVLRL